MPEALAKSIQPGQPARVRVLGREIAGRDAGSTEHQAILDPPPQLDSRARLGDIARQGEAGHAQTRLNLNRDLVMGA
jgi:hypothetical protein